MPKKVAKKETTKKPKADSFEDQVLEARDFLLEGGKKKFDQLSLFKVLKSRGHCKNAPDLIEAMVKLEKKKKMLNIGGGQWR